MLTASFVETDEHCCQAGQSQQMGAVLPIRHCRESGNSDGFPPVKADTCAGCSPAIMRNTSPDV